MNGTVHAFQSLQSLQVPQPLQSLQPHRSARPERAEVEAAVRTIIRWAGDGPDRQGLSETPARVVRALEEFFAGYEEDPAAVSQKSFDEIYGFMTRWSCCATIAFESHCEHHMAPSRLSLGVCRFRRS